MKLLFFDDYKLGVLKDGVLEAFGAPELRGVTPLRQATA